MFDIIAHTTLHPIHYDQSSFTNQYPDLAQYILPYLLLFQIFLNKVLESHADNIIPRKRKQGKRQRHQ